MIAATASGAGLVLLVRLSGQDDTVNKNGYLQTLQPAQPENTNAAKSGIYSPRLREPRARQIAQQVLEAPWAVANLDAHGAAELGRLEAPGAQLARNRGRSSRRLRPADGALTEEPGRFAALKHSSPLALLAHARHRDVGAGEG